jgi:cysteine-rich repeat protein
MLVMGLTGCLGSSTTECNGVLCPAGKVCTSSGGCATPEQALVCNGAAELDPCQFTGTPHGICHDGVCVAAGCGNGIVEPGELCDDGNIVSGDGCRADCQSDERCGNAVLDPQRNEGCDCGDGSQSSLPPGCTGPNSDTTPGATCTSQCKIVGCGDGAINGLEQCEGTNLGGKTCADVGFYGGTLQCNAQLCRFDTSGCTGTCGDNTINDPSEKCDGTDLAGKDCTDFGFYTPGGLACTSFCSFDTAACSGGSCGDGVKNGPEDCDGADLGTADCTTIGFYDASGLACTGLCSYDTSACTGRCGDGVKNGTEQCDGTDLGTADCTTVGFDYPSGLGCTGLCSYDTSACTGRCGDGVLDPGEVCDGAVPASLSCTYFGYDYGRLGCTGLCGPEFSQCGSFGFHTMASGPTPGDVNYPSISGTSDHDVIVAGHGHVWRFDGTSWHAEPISPLSPDPNLQILRAVFAFTPTDAWAGGNDGLFHWDGVTWTKAPDSPPYPGGIIEGIWGDSPADVYAVGYLGTILHYDGSAWTSMVSPTPFELNDVWGSGPSDVWATSHNYGALYHWDGTTWIDVTPYTQGLYAGVGGTGANDVFFADDSSTSITHWGVGDYDAVTDDGMASNDILGVAPGDVYAVGDVVAHYDENSATWTPMSVDGPGGGEKAWASGPGDVWTIAGGSILRGGVDWGDTGVGPTTTGMSGLGLGMIYGARSNALESFDGLTWTSLIPAYAYAQSFWVANDGEVFTDHLQYDGTTWWTSPCLGGNAMWGSSPTDLFAVGNSGAITHCDGTTATSMVSSTTDTLVSVSGTSATDVWAAGGAASGRILHYDGTAWSTSATPAAFIDSVSAAPGIALASGDNGTILSWDGTTWQPMSSGTTTSLYQVWADNPTDAWALNPFLLIHWNGASWSPIANPGTFPMSRIWGRAANDVYLLENPLVYHWDGTSWTLIGSDGAAPSLISGNATDVFTLTTGTGSIGKWDGTAWQTLLHGQPGAVRATWAVAANAVFAVGLHTLYLWEGTRARVFDTFSNYVATWAASPSDAWAVGDDIRHFDGTSWATAGLSATECKGVWGSGTNDVHVVCGGSISDWNGSAWNTTTVPSLMMTAVWGSGPSDAFAVGWGGTVMHWDGTVWTAMTSNTTQQLNAVWGNAPDDVFAAGAAHTVIHWDGVAWSPVRARSVGDFESIWGKSGNFLFADDGGHIWRFVGRLPH